MEKCIVLGGEGMLGSMVVEYFKQLPEFKTFYTVRHAPLSDDEVYFDALYPSKAEEIFEKIKPHLVINCIGIINRFITEENILETISVNSYLPHKIAQICKNRGIKMIHISTDCVFSGKEGSYNEDSIYSPTDFYGLSKAEGEIKDNHNLTIRTSIIGPEIKEPKTELMEWLFKQKGEKVKGFANVIWSGVTTLELAKKIVEMYKKNVSGILTLASEPITKYDLLCLINNTYGLGIEIIKDDTFVCDRSMKSIRNDVEYAIPSMEDMIKELKEWRTTLG